MGMIHADLDLIGIEGRRATVRFLVDSGAIYSVLPEPVWHAIGLQPTRDLEFVLADGTSIRRRISDCRFIYQGIEAPSPVVLGEGKRLFKDSGAMTALRLAELRPVGRDGVLVLVYRRAEEAKA